MSLRKLAFTVLLLCLSASAQIVPGGGSAPGGTITGQIQTATGGAIKSGTLTFSLSQPAIVSNSASLATTQVACYTSAAGNIVGVPDPLALPTLSANLTTGTLPAGTYYVQFFYTSPSGTSVTSPELAFNLTSQGTLNINPPVLQPASATGFGVAIGATSGSELIQGTVSGFTQFQQSQPLLAGGPPPTINTSSCNLYFSDQLIPTGTYYTVNLINKNASQVAGFPQTWCTYGGGGGVINVSQGAPTGNCNVSGVFYPTPIFANSPSGLSQSISGPISFTGLVSAANANFNGNLTFGGTETFSGTNNFTGTNSFTGISTFTGTYFSSSAANPAATGVFRMATGDTTCWRNFTNSADICIAKDASDRISLSNQNISGNLDLGKLTSYGGFATVGNGLGFLVAVVDLTAQTAAASGNLFVGSPSGPPAGQYRATWDVKVTTVAGVSSTLGPLTLTYTDPDGTAQTLTCPASLTTGAVATSSTGNTTTTVLFGLPVLLNVKALTSVGWSFGYASSAANVMTYNLHIRLEAL